MALSATSVSCEVFSRICSIGLLKSKGGLHRLIDLQEPWGILRLSSNDK